MSYTETSHRNRVWAEVDPDAAACNIEGMHALLKPGTKMCPAVKADGYGHGALRIAKRLETLEYIWGFAVAAYEEAEELRAGGIGKPLLILGKTFPENYEDLWRLDLRPTVFDAESLREISAAASSCGQLVRIHIAVDTGMSRIGVRPDAEGLQLVNLARSLPGIAVEGVFTHFSKSDCADPSNTHRQLREFTEFCDRAEQERGLPGREEFRIPIRHCSNSAAILRFPEANLDMVRPGITTYGLWPSDEVPHDIMALRPALSLYSRVIMVKTIPAGTSVSYGGIWTASRDTILATIPVGYGDGYARSLSDKGSVLIRGQRAPIRGRVCMDQFMADVTDIPGVQNGDVVTLIGRDGDEIITMEELGAISGRFNYEFACCLSKRIPRIYCGNGQA